MMKRLALTVGIIGCSVIGTMAPAMASTPVGGGGSGVHEVCVWNTYQARYYCYWVNN